MIETAIFYIFALLLILSAIMVVTVRNPVHAVLFLIFSFVNAAGLCILMGAELIAMLLIIVYVGAVAVLFLFVVMMLNINFMTLRKGFLKFLPLGLFAGIVLFLLLNAFYDAALEPETIMVVLPEKMKNLTNSEWIGTQLYTDFIYPFQMSGLILMIAMIGAIVLTHRHREGVKKQIISKQLDRQREDGVELINVKKGAGVNEYIR